MDLADAAARVDRFAEPSLTHRIAAIEHSLRGMPADRVASSMAGIDIRLVEAGSVLKQVAGQVHVLVHAAGILVALPHILEPDEMIESLSLGAGNTGKDFDLVTSRRLAEFKFIHWKGGPESIRQNSVFQDFFHLAEAETDRRRVLYLLGLARPLRFFRGGRALSSVMSRNQALREAFRSRYGERFVRVRDYFAYRGEQVELVDLTAVVPGIGQALGLGAATHGG